MRNRKVKTKSELAERQLGYNRKFAKNNKKLLAIYSQLYYYYSTDKYPLIRQM